jgi:hypothetical protein
MGAASALGRDASILSSLSRAFRSGRPPAAPHRPPPTTAPPGWKQAFRSRLATRSDREGGERAARQHTPAYASGCSSRSPSDRRSRGSSCARARGASVDTPPLWRKGNVPLTARVPVGRTSVDDASGGTLCVARRATSEPATGRGLMVNGTPGSNSPIISMTASLGTPLIWLLVVMPSGSARGWG